MIKHIVLFRFKPETTEIDRAAMADDFAVLPDKIPEILRWRQGINMVLSARNYDFCLMADFATLDDLKTYQSHPDHAAVVQSRVQPLVSDVAVIDCEAEWSF